MKYLGIDYGHKRVGLATSDDGGFMAFPKMVLNNNLSLIDNILELCKEEKISAIVLGESNNSSGKPNKIMGSIEEFKRNIEAETDIPVYFEKEFMTSVHSLIPKTKNIFSARKIKKEKNSKDDSKAATLILQRFLDKNNKK